MRHRGLTKVLRIGEKQVYSQRIEWRCYRKYVPDELKIQAENQPDEEWWVHENERIHVDRYLHEAPMAK